MMNYGGMLALIKERKFIPCPKCTNFAYCIEDGSRMYNTVEEPCPDAEPAPTQE